MALWNRRKAPAQVDYDELAKALSPMFAQAAQNSRGGVSGSTYPVNLPSSPFSQTGGGTFERPLPRNNAEFNSLFGPGYPFVPDPLDPLGANGRVMPRRSEYLVAWNLQIVDRQVPWTMLRWLAEDCDVINRAIQLKQDEVVGYEWSWGFSQQLLAQIKEENGGGISTGEAWQLARDKYGTELLMVQRFMEQPDSDMNQDFASWMQAVLWDHFVYDGVAVYPHYNMGGTLRNLELIDASTIKLLRDNRGRIPRAPSPAYQQMLYGFPRGEYQHTPGPADDEFTDDQLAYFIRRPRNTTVYGYPQVEEALALATTYLGRQAWMRAEYTHGVTPKVFMQMADTETWTPEQMAWFEQAFNDRLTGQIERRQTAFLLRPGMVPQFAPQLEEHYKSDYDNWLISQIGARFGVAATQLGVQAKAGLSGGKQMEGESSQAEQFSTLALINFLISMQNTLVRRYLGVGPEITAQCSGGQNEAQLQEAQADVALVNGGILLRTEARNKRGLPVLDVEEADQLAVTTAQGVTFLAGTFQAQKEAIASGATPGTATTDPSHAGEAPGAPAPSAATPPEPEGVVKEAEGAARELAAFRRFKDTRLAKGRAWRDFEFHTVEAKTAQALNEEARCESQLTTTAL